MPDPYGKSHPDPVASGLITARHVDVINLVARGYSNDRIGRELGISTDTVKTHLRRIFRRLGANDRANLILIAVARDVIRIEDHSLPPVSYR